MDSELRDLLIVLITLPAVGLILRRLGLPVRAAGLLLFSVIVPLLGHVLVLFYILSRPWPRLPALPKRVVRERL